MQTLLVTLFNSALFHFGSALGQGHGSASATVGPTPPSVFEWKIVSNMVTCHPATVSWLYSPLFGSPLMSISISNDGVAQPVAPSTFAVGSLSTHNSRSVSRGSVLRRAPVNQEISPGLISANLPNFTWPQVNVSAGWYELQATFAVVTNVAPSVPFYVENGTDVSCLLPAAPPISTSTSTLTSKPTNRVGASSSSSPRANVIGGVIGGLVVLVGLITACTCYYRYRRRARQWTSLTSTTYTSTIFPRTAELTSKERREYITNQLAAVQTQLAGLQTKTATAADAPAPVSDSTSANLANFPNVSMAPAGGDGAGIDAEVRLRTQNETLQARIRILEEQLQSQWALGLSDEPPPGYLE
ncbi:hypothetical protein GGX14DRAFT_578324 [Mycena pura]|uniref:Uncharacterized protein n=1 Tax=Mycena pura TaxID=153505 RepID=A0AAD6Y1F2_9AGAR|nr:hypothetical protein GGX14DRAFT_578324 [Mycena pura]